jgi:hypothetical protein
VALRRTLCVTPRQLEPLTRMVRRPYTVQDLAFSTVSPLPDATRNVAYSTTLQTTGGRHRKPHFRGY